MELSLEVALRGIQSETSPGFIKFVKRQISPGEFLKLHTKHTASDKNYYFLMDTGFDQVLCHICLKDNGMVTVERMTSVTYRMFQHLAYQ